MIYVYSLIALALTLGFVFGFIALFNKLAGGPSAKSMEHHEDQRSQRGRY